MSSEDRRGADRGAPLVPTLMALLLARLTASRTARRGVRFFDDQGGRLLAIVALDLVGAVSVAVTPFVLRAVVDDGLIDRSAPQDRAALIGQVALLLAAFLLQAMLGAVSTLVGSGVGERVHMRATVAIHDQLLRLPFSFFPGQRHGDVLTLFGGDIAEVRSAVSLSVPRAISAGVTAVVGVVSVVLLDWRLALVAVLLSPLVFGLMTLGRRRGRELTREHIKLRSAHFALITDTTSVSGALHVRLFGRSLHESGRLATIADQTRRISLKRIRVSALAQLMSSAGAALAIVAVMSVGIWLVSTQRATVGTLVAFASALLFAYRPVTGLAESRADLIEAGVAFDRIFGLLDLVPDPRDLPTTTTGAPEAARPGAGPVGVPAPREATGPGAGAGSATTPGAASAPEIVVDAVWFRYAGSRQNAWSSAGRDVRRRWWYVADDEEEDEEQESRRATSGEATPAGGPGPTEHWALRDVQLTAGAGEKTAIVGASGAGKTTLGYLLSGVHRPDRGRLLLDGTDFADLTWSALRATIGVVPQDPHLFNDTIAANVRYGRLDATDEAITAAVVDAGLGPMLERLPRGIRTKVGARGYQLSGGERQRLALARVLIADPPVLILDEATSQLDAATEHTVQEALTRLGAGRTRLVIAHRLSTIVDADRIYVMGEGSVVEHGTHAELIKADGAYARLYHRQLRREVTRAG
ncbi:ABC transporter ATP-binding protein [Parafrankia discariae]|uniref:ABC transporter ATP-binding protein n=1 Tax=Parafrankia discariae TaxID=365528 RepID=UPI0007C6C184|nr:ABC transporter ATP-binding protein [Parafrankia discariae]